MLNLLAFHCSRSLEPVAISARCAPRYPMGARARPAKRGAGCPVFPPAQPQVQDVGFGNED
eukprot:2528252-Pyramimonas_sp.AAC.1